MKSLWVAFICACGVLAAAVRPLAAAELVVTADVPTNSSSLTTTILKFLDGDPDKNPWTNSSVENTLDFGELTYLFPDGSNAGAFFSRAGYCVVIVVEPFGKPFNITAGCTGVSDTNGHTLPAGSFGMIPVYSNADVWKFPGGQTLQGDLPAGASLGVSRPVVPGGLVYSSESGTATARIVQLYLSLGTFLSGGGTPFDGYVPIPLTQQPGHYTATVTLTFALK
jgi:hypothetical protein